MDKKETVALITGATGFVGGRVAVRLAAEGWEVRSLVRRPGPVERLDLPGITLVQGDLTDADSLQEPVICGTKRLGSTGAAFASTSHGSGGATTRH